HQVERVARGVGVGSAGQGVGRLLGYATHASVAWMYGPAQLGFYALGITVVQVASILSQLGLDNSVVRYRSPAPFARDIMLFFGKEFARGWPVMVVICAPQLFNSSVGPTSRLLAMTGHQNAVMVSTVGGAAVALNLLLVPAYGVAGAAAATAAALVLANGSSLIFVYHRLGFWPYDRRYARPLLAGLLAAALTLASRQLLPSVEGLPAIVLFAPLTLAFFFGALLCLGLYPSDRLYLASFAGALKDTLGREPPR
ncbi:MAG: polysaccharide biosynthesis C-terminal domain-containing protein, partial [Actinomycetota bacterium]|nr:polysaccharide biosynthesis C-terminal domain-containing protein [Actinomycetota bacterium]